jgi:serine protease Do
MPPSSRALMRIRSLSFVLAAALLAAGAAAPARAQSIPPKDAIAKSSPPVLETFAEVVVKARLSTVRIRCEDKDAALGTVVGADGWIVTKASQLSGTPICVLPDGREVPARIVGSSKDHDLAMLKADASGLTPIEWRESTAASPGAWVASPGPGKLPLGVGVISVATRKLPAVGIPRYMPSPNSGYLGVTLGPAEGAGATVTEVSSGSPAEKAGVKPKDVVLAVDGKEVADLDDLREQLGRRKSGDKVKLTVKRGEKTMELAATLDKRPASRGDFQNSLGSTLSERRTGFPVILQHDTVLKPTDCGGPVVDLDGYAVGVNIARAGRTESYAIPAEAVRPLLFEMASGQFVPAGARRAAAAPAKPGEPVRAAPKEESPEKDRQARTAPDTAERIATAEAAVARARTALAAAEKALAEAEAALKKATGSDSTDKGSQRQPPK